MRIFLLLLMASSVEGTAVYVRQDSTDLSLASVPDNLISRCARDCEQTLNCAGFSISSEGCVNLFSSLDSFPSVISFTRTTPTSATCPAGSKVFSAFGVNPTPGSTTASSSSSSKSSQTSASIAEATRDLQTTSSKPSVLSTPGAAMTTSRKRANEGETPGTTTTSGTRKPVEPGTTTNSLGPMSSSTAIVAPGTSLHSTTTVSTSTTVTNPIPSLTTSSTTTPISDSTPSSTTTSVGTRSTSTSTSTPSSSSTTSTASESGATITSTASTTPISTSTSTTSAAESTSTSNSTSTSIASSTPTPTSTLTMASSTSTSTTTTTAPTTTLTTTSPSSTSTSTSPTTTTSPTTSTLTSTSTSTTTTVPTTTPSSTSTSTVTTTTVPTTTTSTSTSTTATQSSTISDPTTSTLTSTSTVPTSTSTSTSTSISTTVPSTTTSTSTSTSTTSPTTTTPTTSTSMTTTPSSTTTEPTTTTSTVTSTSTTTTASPTTTSTNALDNFTLVRIPGSNVSCYKEVRSKGRFSTNGLCAREGTDPCKVDGLVSVFGNCAGLSALKVVPDTQCASTLSYTNTLCVPWEAMYADKVNPTANGALSNRWPACPTGLGTGSTCSPNPLGLLGFRSSDDSGLMISTCYSNKNELQSSFCPVAPSYTIAYCQQTGTNSGNIGWTQTGGSQCISNATFFQDRNTGGCGYHSVRVWGSGGSRCIGWDSEATTTPWNQQLTTVSSWFVWNGTKTAGYGTVLGQQLTYEEYMVLPRVLVTPA